MPIVFMLSAFFLFFYSFGGATFLSANIVALALKCMVVFPLTLKQMVVLQDSRSRGFCFTVTNGDQLQQKCHKRQKLPRQ